MEFVSLFIVHILVKTYILQLIKIVLSGKLFPTNEKMVDYFYNWSYIFTDKALY